MKKSFKQLVQSMSASEIIKAMVAGLRKPAYKLNMNSFGYVGVYPDTSGKPICYGCAATNAITQISGVKFNTNNIDNREKRCEKLHTDATFLMEFENAIDWLRLGRIADYNRYAFKAGFAVIYKPGDIYLPVLTSDFAVEELLPYDQLAELPQNLAMSEEPVAGDYFNDEPNYPQ